MAARGGAAANDSGGCLADPNRPDGGTQERTNLTGSRMPPVRRTLAGRPESGLPRPPKEDCPHHLRRTAPFRFDRSHLVDGHEAGFEALAGDAQVDPPDAHTLVAGDLAGAVEVGLEAVLPLQQRA